ncbi:MAG TPA: hypothetical protein PKJ99_05860 [Thermoanaerobaculales bacterium]|nr:hypothetical protein [Thermoanaerobaculales bacterium]HPA79630.1 hypothetical protein [Thermoanaerobaculales bacterium]HQL29670.1 hypothetical protein [Thermoanaerobaculales bacterium]HQN97130.1 hypothetical protein [Thermoanaerobaculales bacterium]HQP43325.1 hypothetical protein [Thermoanaerobaculales bacterium]
MQVTGRKVHILELPSGAYALADPGGLEVDRGEAIGFENQTANDATLFIAEEKVLVEAHPLKGVLLPRGAVTPFTVAPDAEPGAHEYQVLVTLRSGKRVFAVGSSTPRIIIRPPASD